VKLGLAISSLSAASRRGSVEQAGSWIPNIPQPCALLPLIDSKFSRLVIENPLNEIRLLDALFKSSCRFTR
jgi:hypothetical protein